MHTAGIDQPHTEAYLEEVPGAVLPWADAMRRLESAESVWFASVSPVDGPHVVPVLTVLVDDTPYISASPDSRKARNLARDPHCVITAHVDGMDLVVEGVAHRTSDGVQLRQVADAYAEQHGWPVQVRGGALHADGAPTAGPPPYHVFEIRPTRGFAFPQNGQIAPTRWAFEGTSRRIHAS